MIAMLLGLAMADGPITRAGEMEVSWTWEDEHLVLDMTAPTTGWVGLGLNTDAQLANSRLVMVSVDGGSARAEEHVPRPPRHPHVADLDVIESREHDGQVWARVRLPLAAARADAPALKRGDRVWLTLAWSHDADFAHHSAMRTAMWVTLE